MDLLNYYSILLSVSAILDLFVQSVCLFLCKCCVVYGAMYNSDTANTWFCHVLLCYFGVR